MQKAKLRSSTMQDAAIEAIRFLRTNLQLHAGESGMILVTGCTEADGKFTIVTELSKSLAELGKQVLMIDANIRQSVLRYEIADAQLTCAGLVDYLNGKAELDEAMIEVLEPKFFMLPSGTAADNSSVLLSGDEMAELLNWAKERYDYVLINTPPLGKYVDAAVIAPHCDGAIVVIEAGKVTVQTARQVAAQLESARCTVLGTVLNNADSI